MEALQYHIDFDVKEPFDGPLDVLLTLIQKNKNQLKRNFNQATFYLENFVPI